MIETVGVGQSEIEIDHVVDFVVYVVPPGSGDGLQGAKKGVMEIADLIVINKFDGDFKPVCRSLSRRLESALTLTMTKHSYAGANWECPVELVSAETDYNIECIWEHALLFRQQLGEEYLLKRRHAQLQRSMWKFLGDSIMHKLRDDDEFSNRYA